VITFGQNGRFTFTGMGIRAETHFGGASGLRLLFTCSGDYGRLRDALAVFAGQEIDQLVVQPQCFRIKASA
jgi:hypothetical protein